MEGELPTRPFTWPQGELRVNANARDGEVRAEVVDAESLGPLPGRSAVECPALRGNHLATEVKWMDGSAVSFGDRPIRLRFHLRCACLYAFWLT